MDHNKFTEYLERDCRLGDMSDQVELFSLLLD